MEKCSFLVRVRLFIPKPRPCIRTVQKNPNYRPNDEQYCRKK